MKNNQLFNATFLFSLFIIGALIFSGITHKLKGYKTSNTDILNELSTNDYTISYFNFYNLYNDSLAAFTIVDLREPEKFAIKHLRNAINIPFNALIDKENFEKIEEDNRIKFIIADEQNKSALAYLMYRSSGIENIKIIPGTFDILYQNIINENNPSFYYYDDDKAKWDYKRQMGGASTNKTSTVPQIPQQTDIKVPVKGGC